MPISAHTNFGYSTLATPPSGTDGTSLTVASGTGALFPVAPFNATIWPADAAPVSTNAEIVRVTAKATDTFTITRAQEGTSARTHLANAQIAAGVTARVLTDIEYGAHGIFNVKDPVYGATGDGVTDDTAAIQAALDAAYDAGGGTVLLEVGSYRTTGTLTVNRNVALVGATADNGATVGAVLVAENAAGAHAVTVDGRYWRLENLSILGITGGGNGVHISALSLNGSMSNVYIEDCGGKGVYVAPNNSLMTFHNVRANGCRSYGFHFDGSTNSIEAITATGCYANGCGLSGTLSGWLFDGASGCMGFALEGCASDNNTNAGFQIANFYGTLTSCTAEANTVYGFRVDGVGHVVYSTCHTVAQAAPFSVAAAANVTFLNPRTVTTVSGYSIQCTNAATGENVLIGDDSTTALDAGVQVVAGGVLKRSTTNSVKVTSSIADATPTTVATITVPNASVATTVRFKILGSLGAGGAVGANEASATNTYDVVISRVAGVNAAAAISAASGAAASAVAGAATVTATLALGAVAGAVGAVNTIPVQVTITKSGGASANHSALVSWDILDANASRVTVA